MSGADRWQARPAAAAALRGAVLAVPLLAAVGSGLAVARALRGAPGAVRLLLVVGVALLVLVAVDRALRRLLPLAALLELSLLFPDRSPARLALALRAGSTRELVRVREAGSGSAAEAAEQVLALLAALARHDPGSRRHSERVRAYVDLLAEALRLPPADRDRLRWAALVHDLGKTTVDVGVLRKPSRLDEHEWRLVREHPAAGARLAAGLAPFLGPWFDGIGQHHERYDGTGYPAGLAGEQISRAARIISVADALEVMTAARPYQRPVDPGVARAELVRCGGSQFDPEVVRALLGLSLPRLRRVLGPLAGLGALALSPRLPEAERLVSTGSDAGLPDAPPAPELELEAALVGMHPAAGLPVDSGVAPGSVPTGHDAGGTPHHAAPDGGPAAAAGLDQR
jgi:hypothetical protein